VGLREDRGWWQALAGCGSDAGPDAGADATTVFAAHRQAGRAAASNHLSVGSSFFLRGWSSLGGGSMWHAASQ